MRNYPLGEDAELITALNQGEDAAFAAIYEKYAKDLYNYARHNLTSKEDCEEIVHDVFTWVWQNRATIKIESSLRFYLITAVKRKVLRYFQKVEVRKKYERHYELFEAVYDIYKEEQQEIDPVAMEQWINKSISNLPETWRAAFLLRYKENLSNGEIAERMNINKRMAENHVFRAISYLRTSYRKLSPSIIILSLLSYL